MYDCIPCLLLLGQVAIELLCKNSTSTAKQGISLSYCSLTAALQASSCRDGNTGEILRDIANANSVVALSGLHTANTRLSGGLRPNGTPDTHKYSTHDGRQATYMRVCWLWIGGSWQSNNPPYSAEAWDTIRHPKARWLELPAGVGWGGWGILYFFEGV